MTILLEIQKTPWSFKTTFRAHARFSHILFIEPLLAPTPAQKKAAMEQTDKTPAQYLADLRSKKAASMQCSGRFLDLEVCILSSPSPAINPSNMILD